MEKAALCIVVTVFVYSLIRIRGPRSLPHVDVLAVLDVGGGGGRSGVDKIKLKPITLKGAVLSRWFDISI